MDKLDVLVPEATQNLVKNPSFEKSLIGLVPLWEQEATFEKQELTPNPTGFDSLSGVGAIEVNSIAAIRGKFGAFVDATDGNSRIGILSGPNSETTITLELYIKLGTLSMTAGDSFTFILVTSPGAGNAFDVDLTNVGGTMSISSSVSDDAGAPITNVDALPTTEVIKIRFEFLASSGADDGIFRVYLNDALVSEETGIDNDTHNVTNFWTGIVTGLDAGTTGAFYLDNLRWAKGFQPFVGSSLTRTLERARFGRFSTEVITDGYSMNEGVYARVDTTGINGQVTASTYIRGNGKVRVRIKDGLTGATKAQSPPVTINDKRWHRIEVTGQAVGGDDFQIHVETAELIQQNTFYVDGFQLEEKDIATVYCDGTQPGCRWNGVANLSISEREATEMKGGRWVSIRDDECHPDTYVTAHGGFGMPPVTINRQSTAQADGSVFDSVKSEERLIQMTIWTKDEDAQKQKGNSQERINELRQILIDLVKPDNSPNSEAFILRVTENNREFTIACRYESGLEFDSDVRDKWKNTIPLRLLCLDPFWTEDGQEVALLDTENTFENNSVIFSRVEGAWGIPGLNGFNADKGASAIVVDPDGRIYFGGNFTTDGDGNVLRFFASFNNDFTQMIERGTGVNNNVLALAPHPNGKIYLGGNFTADNNGNAMARVAEYDPDTDVLSALGAGVNGTALGISISPTGRIYFVGAFSTAGGIAVDGIAYWDGVWQTLGDFNGDLGATTKLDVLAISDDEVYVVGNQVDGGVLARWNGSEWEMLYHNATAGGNFFVLAQDIDGTILFGGSADNTQLDGELRRWNGSATTQLGENFTNIGASQAAIFGIAVGEDGLIYIAGDFNAGGSGLEFPFPGAIWNGSTYVYFDAEVSMPAGSSAWGLLVLSNGDIYVGGNDIPGNTKFAGSGIITVQNVSTKDVFPIVTITGTGKIIWLENQTTGQRVFMDYTLQEDEELTIDFTEGLKVTSNYKGDVPDAVLPNSDDFFLAAGNLNEPKDNIIAVFMVDEVDPVVQLRYTPTHWSIDAVAN